MSTLLRVARHGALASLLVVAACGQSGVAQQVNRSTAQETTRATASPPQAPVDTLTAARLSGAFRAAAERALPAVVYVSVESRPTTVRVVPDFPYFSIPRTPNERQVPVTGTGSGFVFDSRGYIMTNAHVVRDAINVTVQLHDGRVFDAEVVGADASTDVAVLKINPRKGETLPIAELGDSDNLRVGDWVLALGNPLGLEFTVTAGIVSAQGRSIGILRQNSETALEAFIQTDAAINRGNSGGPLVDLMGRVIGINTAIESPNGYNAGYGFAIPINLARRVASDLLEYGELRRPRLGVEITDVTDVAAELYGLKDRSGALVSSVQEGLPAARAGIQLGDVITAVDGRPVRNGSELLVTLAQYRPGDKVRLTVIRDQKAREITVELAQFESVAARGPERKTRQTAEDLLGFSVAPLTSNRARDLGYSGSEGVVIREVSPRITTGGLAPNMVVLKINGQKVTTPRDVERIAERLEPGDPVAVVVWVPGVGERLVTYRTRR